MAEPYCTSTEDAKRRAEFIKWSIGGGSASTVVGGSVVTKGPNVRPATDDEQRCMNGLSGYSIGGWNAYTLGEFSTDSVTITSEGYISAPTGEIVLKQESKMGVYRVYAVDRQTLEVRQVTDGEIVARNAEQAKMSAAAIVSDVSNMIDFDRWHWHAERVFEFDVLED